MKIYKFAIIGTGYIAHYHAKAIKLIKNAELVAVFGRSEEKTKNFAAHYGIKYYTDYEELLKEQIDVVNIIIPHCLHVDTALKAAEAGKHIIIEKPIDISLNKSKNIINFCKSKNLKLSVISQKRFCNSFIKTKNYIPKLGKINLVSLSMVWHRPKEYYSGWKADPKQSGGGVLIMQGIHYIDLLKWLFGPVEDVYFNATNNYGLKVEDSISGNIKFKSGCLATIKMSTCSEQSMPDRIEIHGEKGSIIIEDERIIYLINKKQHFNIFKNLIPKRFYYKKSLINQFKAQFENILKSIDENKEPLINGYEGLEDLKIVKGIYKSINLGKKVRLK